MFNIAIVEDEDDQARDLLRLVERSCKELKKECRVERFANGMDFVSDYKPKYDLLLLDIEMPYLGGLESAHKIREVDREVAIVFVTNLAQYAVKGYDVSARDFFVKPVTYETFFPKFKKLALYLETTGGKQMIVASDGVIYRVNVRDIYYIEVRGHCLEYHLRDKTLSARGAMDQKEAELEGYGFFRIFKSYLVNMAHVSEIRNSTVIAGTDELALSRFKKKEFLTAFTLYMGEQY